jgi:hypothetical protein
MDEGLREAIALADAVAGGNAKRPLPIETLINSARQAQGLAQALPTAAAKRILNSGRKAGRTAALYLRPGGELRRRLESGELMSEEEWERLCGPPIS